MTKLTKKTKDEWKDDKRAFIKFQANWCGPCTMFEPVVEKVSKEFKSVNFYSVDIEEMPDLATEFGVTGIPTCVVVSDGKVLKKFSGMKTEELLRQILNKLVEVTS